MFRTTLLGLIVACTTIACHPGEPTTQCETEGDCRLWSAGYVESEDDFCCFNCSQRPVSESWAKKMDLTCARSTDRECPEFKCAMGSPRIAKCVNNTCILDPVEIPVKVQTSEPTNNKD